MKKAISNLTFFLFFFLLTCECQDSQTRTIYDFYVDKHDEGKWEGYSYFLAPEMSAEGDIPKRYLTLNESGLIIEDTVTFQPLSFNFICDFEENLPCSVVQFKKMFQRKFESFVKNIELLINKTKIADIGDQCMVLHVREESGYMKPHLICLYVQEQGVNLKSAIHKAYISEVRNSDIEKTIDNVQIGEVFDLLYAYDEFFSYIASATVKETEIIFASPKNKTIIIPYNEITSPFTQAHCKMEYKNLSVPAVIDVKDNACCVNFNYTPGSWFVCSTQVSDCISPIRRLALFMMKTCQLLYVKSSKIYKNVPDYMQYTDDSAEGLWSGWAYFTYLKDIKSNLESPIFLKIDQKFLSISIEETALPNKTIEILSLKWICGQTHICSPTEYEKYSLNAENIDDTMKNINKFIKDVGISVDSCGIFQDFSNKELMICIYNPGQYVSFENAMVLNYKTKLRGLSMIPPLPDNAIVPMLVTDGTAYFNEPVQFQIDLAMLFRRPNSLPVVIYQKIDSINGESCQVLVRQFNIPSQVLEYPIDSQNNTVKGGECCLTMKYFNRMIYMCSLSDDCEKIIERAAKKIHQRCEKGKYPNNLENSPEIDYNSEIKDKHQTGYWSGYVKYAQVGIETPRRPMFVEVDSSKKTITVRSYSKSDEIHQTFDILKMEWVCQSELPCGPEEYISKKNDKNLKRMIDRIYLEMNLFTSLHCTVLEVRATVFYFSQKMVGLFCPYDKTQGTDFRMAIKNAYDELIEKTQAKSIPFAPEGSEYMIYLYNADSRNNNLTSFRARLNPTYIERIPDEIPVIMYRDIKEIGNVKCGLEFRNLTIPPALLDLNTNPQCCFALMKNNDKIFICSSSEIRCITESRMMMKRIKEDCMTLMSINHEVSSQELKVISEEFELADENREIPDVLGPPKSNDASLQYDLEINIWEGMIFISTLDNRDQVNLQKKFLKLEDDFIKITQGPDTIGNSYLTESYHIFTVFFACNSPDLCHPSNYINQMATVRSQYEIQLLTSAIENFMVKLPDGTKESDCLILEFEEPYFHAIRPHIICTKDQNQGFFLRKIISARYVERIAKMDFNSTEARYLPYLSIKDKFPLRFYEENSEDVSSYLAVFNEKSILRDSTDFSFLKFTEIEDCQAISPVENKKVVQKILNDKIDINCCFEIMRFSNSLIICSIDSFRCVRSRNMIIRHALIHCHNQKADDQLSLVKRYFRLNYDDDFSFEMPRVSELIITSETDTSPLKDDFFDDSDNGVWKGWIFATTLTERKELPVQAFYLEISRNYVTYRSKANGILVFLKPTKYIRMICEEAEGPCSPSEYLEIHQSRNFPFVAVFQLKEAIINFLDQLPTIDERGCVVLEFIEPKTRTRISEIICTLFPEDGDSMVTAFGNAFYLSQLRSNVAEDVPMPSYMTEYYYVKIWEEKRLIADWVTFNEIGLLKNNTDVILYRYNSVANDQLGNRCAFWFRNLYLPEEFGDHDPNCCFTFSMTNGRNVFICATMRRCIRNGKMILLKMKFGCLSQNSAQLISPYENENSAAPLRSVDNYFKVLYDDSDNGIWRGLVFHHKIGSDETIPENPHYMKIENGYISFYEDENYKNLEGVEMDPKEKLIIRNMIFTCEQPFTCDITHYIEFFKETVSDDGYDVFKLKKDIQKVTDNLPKDSDLDNCCTIISLKDENSFKSNYIICTRVSEQGEKLKKALTYSLNNIIINSNIKREIPLARLEDSFQIQYFDAITKQRTDLNVRFGKYYMFDLDSGQTILKYTDLKNDSYGNKCAIWNTQLTLPSQITTESKECCFMFNKNDLSYYICSAGKFHCIKKSRIMIKTVKEGCLAEANGLQLNGSSLLDVPENRNPNTEILGEKEKHKENTFNNTSSDSEPPFNITHELNENLFVTKQKNSFYKSWMMEFIFPNAPTETLSPREVYVEITTKKIKIFREVNQDILEEFNLTSIHWVCYKEYPCLPSELRNHYRYLKDVDLDLNLIEEAYSKYQEVISDEKQCLAFEFFKNMSIVTYKRIFCISVYNEKIMDFLQKSIVSGYHEAVKTMPFELVRMPVEYEDKFFVEYLAPGSKNVQSLNMNFGEMGIEYEKETMVLYQSPDNCDFCFDVVEKIENIHTINKCCLKFRKNGLESYICDLDAYRCDMNIKRISSYLYSKCLDFNKNALGIHVPGYCLIEKKQSLIYFPESHQTKNDFNVGKMLEDCAEEHLKSIKKSIDLQQIIETHLLRVNQEMNKLTKNVISVEKNNEDTINHNDDGTQTTIKPNGTKIIEDLNNSIKIIIKSDNTIEIIYFDGADYFINGNGENDFHLPKGVLIKIRKGNYEVDSPELHFQLHGNGTACLKENNGKTTYFDSEDKITTVLNDGTKIKKKANGLTEINVNGTVSVIKTPDV